MTGEMGNHPYYYPPWFAWIFIPFVALPFQITLAVWMIINVIPWQQNISWAYWMVIGLFFLTFWSLYQRMLSHRQPGSQRVGEQ
jgi:hypothetical protein